MDTIPCGNIFIAQEEGWIILLSNNNNFRR